MKPRPAARGKARNFREMGWGCKSQNVSKKSRGCHETFARGFSSIRVQPSSGCSGWKEFKEKPRGGSRGVIDTQSFRLLDQEEEVPATRGYSPPASVSTLSSLDKSRLTRSQEESTHEKQFAGSHAGSGRGFGDDGSVVCQAGDEDAPHQSHGQSGQD